MEKTPRFWLNIRERYCQKQTLPISESVPFKPMKPNLYNLCQPYPCIVGNDFGIEVCAVELVRSEDLMSDIDLCGERSAENLFVKTDRLSPHAVFLDDVRKDVVVFLKGADGTNDVVIMFHYSHSCKF